MKIAITSSARTLAEPVDMHFGRARYFILTDTETGRSKAHDNLQNLQAAQGAGVQTAEALAKLGAEAVITGSVGPKAFRALQAAGIRIALVESACPGIKALRRFKDGKLSALDQPNFEGHWV